MIHPAKYQYQSRIKKDGQILTTNRVAKNTAIFKLATSSQSARNDDNLVKILMMVSFLYMIEIESNSSLNLQHFVINMMRRRLQQI